MSNKQSSVEWLVDKLMDMIHESNCPELSKLYEQAKEMHKKEIIDAFGVGCHHESKRLVGYQDVAEQYYELNFKGDES